MRASARLLVISSSVVLACTGDSTDPVAAPWDEYVLESTGPRSVPIGFVHAGSVRLNLNGSFVDRLTTGSRGHEIEHVRTGTYDATATRIELRYGDSRPFVYDTIERADAVLTRNDCTALRVCAAPMVYRRGSR